MNAYLCDLCQRQMKAATTSHHLIPRACHRRSWFKKRYTKVQMRTTVELCGDCHRAVHQLLPDEHDLGRNYYTLDLLRAHPAMDKFLVWVRKQK